MIESTAMTRTKAALLAVLIAGGLSAVLAGCTGAGGKPRIGVALCNIDDSFVAAARVSLEAKASGKARISILDGQNQQVVQNAQLDAMIEDKAQAIIVNLVDSSVMRATVFRAKAGNVPIVIFGRTPSVSAINAWDKAYFVGTDSTQAAELQAQILADYWISQPEADKDGDGYLAYVLIQGDDNALAASATMETRAAAFVAAGVKTIPRAQVSAKWNRIAAQEALSAIIKEQGADAVEAVICANDEMALGAVAALKQVNMINDRGAFVPVVGVDGTRFALDAIADGSLLGTVRCDADSQGKAAFDLALSLAEGLNPTTAGWDLVDGKYVLFPYVKITLENCRSFM
jgi:methyl-galactoside transport system substrate-binding protein